MSQDHDSAATVVSKVITVVLLWVGGIKLGDIQAVVGILSGLAVGAYALLQFIALWKREFKGK